jgi:hypothetical protein
MKGLAQTLAAAAGGGLVVILTLGASLGLGSDGIRFPDGTVQTTAAPADPRRSYYLTGTTWTGANALLACTAGYHTASLWEILDVSNLRYASELQDARQREDSGDGPPSGAEGWIRTGYTNVSNPVDIGSAGDGGFRNCDAYTVGSSDADGTVVALNLCWQEAADCGGFFGRVVAPWWNAADWGCDEATAVWCVQD